MKTIIEELDFERETKGSVLYKNAETGPGVAVYNIYIRKQALGEVYPNKIQVTIEAVDTDG